MNLLMKKGQSALKGPEGISRRTNINQRCAYDRRLDDDFIIHVVVIFGQLQIL